MIIELAVIAAAALAVRQAGRHDVKEAKEAFSNQEKPKRYQYRDNTDSIKEKVFNNSLTLYLSSRYPDLIDWDYARSDQYEPTCVHYIQPRNFVRIVTEKGSESLYVSTEEVWSLERKTQEEIIRVTMDEYEAWIETIFLAKILPKLKEMELAANGESFIFPYEPDDGKDKKFYKELAARIEENTDYMCCFQDGKLMCGMMAA